MYAEMLYGYDRIIVNPAFEMGETMKAHGMTGQQQFQNPRQDGVQEFMVTKQLVKAYKEMTEQCFNGVTQEEQSRVWGLFGDEDTTVDTIDIFKAHYQTAICFHGEHRMNDNSFMHAVVPVIRWIDDRQEGRERPIIYIGVDALIDKYQKPLSSSQKTIRTLLENYQLYFVAEAPTDARHYEDINQWLYEYVNVPAWGHTVFTNQRELLYGDYFISTAEKWNGMATHLQFGSDTFKTWDDVAEYFSRLGGQ
jgi:5'(3')-deoxyribonucleotidase